MSEAPNAGSGRTPLPDDGGDALAPGTRLAEFEIREVLGVGGFGIVYRAWDDALQRDVALKEYMPTSLAVRGAGERVTLRARVHEEDFALGLRSFVNEARLLARFDQPALVKVFRFWEGNGTAYMAMPLYQGRTLRQLRKERGPGAFNDAWMRALIEPLLGALETMHEAAVYHRDIAPDNILWCDNQRPVLLDFGAARLVLGDRTQNVTAILKPQFAPIEQYSTTQSMRQGPWTDLYALAGTCYFLLVGRAPLPATARIMGDELEPLVRLAPPGTSPQLLQALDWALAVRPQDRPQSVAEWRDALAGRIPIPPRPAVPAPDSLPHVAARSPTDENTIKATVPTAPQRPSAHSPASAAPSGHGHELETPERSVMLPPRSQSPLKAVVLLAVLAAGVAGAWTTRQLWMPAVGLRTAASNSAQAASASEAAASGPESAPLAASAPTVAAVAATTPPAASAVADGVASAAAAPASTAIASVAPAPEPVRAPPAPAPARAKSEKDARSKAYEARLAALKMPPPVLPPPPPGAAATTDSPAAAKTSAQAAPAAASTEAPAARPPNWREVCADQEPAKIAACVKRLCDDDARYQRYPICQRVRRQEEKQQQQGTGE